MTPERPCIIRKITFRGKKKPFRTLAISFRAPPTWCTAPATWGHAKMKTLQRSVTLEQGKILAVPAGSNNPKPGGNFARSGRNFNFSGSQLPGSGWHFPGTRGKSPRRGGNFASRRRKLAASRISSSRPCTNFPDPDFHNRECSGRCGKPSGARRQVSAYDAAGYCPSNCT